MSAEDHFNYFNQIPQQEAAEERTERYKEHITETVEDVTARMRERFGGAQAEMQTRHRSVHLFAPEKISVEYRNPETEAQVEIGIPGSKMESEYFEYPHLIYNTDRYSAMMENFGGIESQKGQFWSKWISVHEAGHFYLGQGSGFKQGGVEGEMLTDETGLCFIRELYPELLTAETASVWREVFIEFFAFNVTPEYSEERGLKQRLQNLLNFINELFPSE